MRASALTGLANCAGFAYIRLDLERGPRYVGGQAAQNGSAVGRVIELWHRKGEDESAMIEAIEQSRWEGSDWPDADWDKIIKWARAYADDPANLGVVVPEWQEREVRLTLDPAPEDPTGDPIEIVGHVDQIRRHPVTGGLTVWDLKSGSAGGEDMTRTYAWQLACYALACTQSLGMGDVLPGGILRLRGYDATPRGNPRVAFSVAWSLDQCREMMGSVRFHVANIRRGAIPLNPGTYCRYCPAGPDPSRCGERVQAILDSEDPPQP